MFAAKVGKQGLEEDLHAHHLRTKVEKSSRKESYLGSLILAHDVVRTICTKKEVHSKGLGILLGH